MVNLVVVANGKYVNQAMDLLAQCNSCAYRPTLWEGKAGARALERAYQAFPICQTIMFYHVQSHLHYHFICKGTADYRLGECRLERVSRAYHINNLQAPRINAAVPVQTPLDEKNSQPWCPRFDNS
jgi:hypothetical protein